MTLPTDTPTGVLSSTMKLDGILVVVLVVLVIVLVVRRVRHRSDQKRRKAGSVSYHDADVAKYGAGPAGFAGAASARSGDGTSLAPSFGASPPTAPTRQAPPEVAPGPTFGEPGASGAWTTTPATGPPPPPAGIPGTPPPPSGPPAGQIPPPPGAPAAPRPAPSAAPAPPPAAAPRSAAPATAPAWLPDPGGSPDVVRYWDGSAWTEHTARRA